MKITFTHYLHDEEFRVKDVFLEAGLEHIYDAELDDKVGRPFYEVTLTCTLDTETGTIEVEDTKL